jgi:hypothetical protein
MNQAFTYLIFLSFKLGLKWTNGNKALASEKAKNDF